MPNRRDFLRNAAGATPAALMSRHGLAGAGLSPRQVGAPPGQRREVSIGGPPVKTLDVNAHFVVPEGLPPQSELFFSLYFCMTGLHALHMIIGIGLLAWLAMKARRGEFTEQYYTPVDMVGLYWHFVDIVWIFLFPLLYLLGRHTL